MSLLESIIEDVDTIFESTFGPNEMPTINKPAVVVSDMEYRGINQDPIEVTDNVEFAIRVTYQTEELTNLIKDTDSRFLIRQKEIVNGTIVPNISVIRWGGREYNVVKCVDVGGIVYDIQANNGKSS